jgi:ribosomal protein S15P/S13E
MTKSCTQAVEIPESKTDWSSTSDARRYIKMCFVKVSNDEDLTPKEIDHLWLIDANLMNRKHENLALHVREVYHDLDTPGCQDVIGKLKRLYKVLRNADRRRKAKLALKKGGISKAQ